MSYASHYSESSFWEKVLSIAGRAGRALLEQALTLYFCLIDPDTPAWARTTIVGALGYLISPVDAIPDLLPGGLGDDAGVLGVAIATVAVHVKDEHEERAAAQVDRVLGYFGG